MNVHHGSKRRNACHVVLIACLFYLDVSAFCLLAFGPGVALWGAGHVRVVTSERCGDVVRDCKKTEILALKIGRRLLAVEEICAQLSRLS